jgi:hypothetical protein
MGFFDKIMDDVLGDPFGSYHQASEAQGAAQVQAGMAQQGIEEQRRASDLARQDLQPFVQQGLNAYSGLQPFIQGGAPAFEQQQAILGLGGPEAQRAEYDAMINSPEYQAMVREGENAMLQNASATGNLRGGNIQDAMMQYRPELLNSLMDKRYGRLGGLAGVGLQTGQNVYQMGQSSAAGQAAQGIQSGAAIAGLLGDKGAALAGGQIAGSKGAGSGLRDFIGTTTAGLNAASGAMKSGLF